jgi:hypothetical protein
MDCHALRQRADAVVSQLRQAELNPAIDPPYSAAFPTTLTITMPAR